ncbi:MAG: DUF4831 family protein [Bacteroidota bacterium]
MAIIFTFLITAFGNNTVQAQIRITPTSDSLLSMQKEGMLYCLPQTMLKIHLVINKTVFTKGVYAANAKDMLGLEKVVADNMVEFSMDKIKISESSIPDPTNYYFLSFRKFPNCHRPQILLSPESFLLGLNIKEIPIREKAIPQDSPVSKTRMISARMQYNYHLNADLFKTIATDTSRFPKYIFRVKTTTDDPILKRARDAAENLARIKENKTNLLGGFQEIAYEKNTFEAMIKGLEAEEEKALSLFTGTTEIIISDIELPYLPEVSDTLAVVIGHFSKSAGFSKSAIADGTAITLTFKPIKDFRFMKASKTKKLPSIRKKGLIVREPVWVEAIVKIGDEVLCTNTVCLPQFGYTLQLPAKTKQASFDCRTGGVIYFR